MQTPTRRGAVAAALAGGTLIASATAADAHSLDSSTISVVVGDDSADATVSVAVDTLEQVLGDDDLSTDEIVAYLDEHLGVTGADGSTWTETWSGAVREQVEGSTRSASTCTSTPAAPTRRA